MLLFGRSLAPNSFRQLANPSPFSSSRARRSFSLTVLGWTSSANPMANFRLLRIESVLFQIVLDVQNKQILPQYFIWTGVAPAQRLSQLAERTRNLLFSLNQVFTELVAFIPSEARAFCPSAPAIHDFQPVLGDLVFQR